MPKKFLEAPTIHLARAKTSERNFVLAWLVELTDVGAYLDAAFLSLENV
jgi:hypothetical protein